MGEYNWVEFQFSDPQSIVNEVLVQLDSLNVQYITEADIPITLKFLVTSHGEEINAWGEWGKYWDSINYKERGRNLKGNPFYSV